jgi:hypothetical protein
MRNKYLKNMHTPSYKIHIAKLNSHVTYMLTFLELYGLETVLCSSFVAGRELSPPSEIWVMGRKSMWLFSLLAAIFRPGRELIDEVDAEERGWVDWTCSWPERSKRSCAYK